MRHIDLVVRSAVLAGLLVVAGTCPAAAQSAANVLVVINEASSESIRIGDYYVAKRKIPAENVIRTKATVADEIDRAYYEFEVERPIAERLTREAFQDRILYIVLTKGIPLRIRGTGAIDGTTASVDSELTLLYRKLLGVPTPPAGRTPNPYYLGDKPIDTAKPFSHAAHDIFLVTRLDGFTADDVIALIDRGTAPSREGIFVLDQRASLLGNQVGDNWLNSAAERLKSAGFDGRVVLEGTRSAPASEPSLGYYSWGSNDPAITVRKPAVTFAPGALAGMFVSTDARTFTEPSSTWTVGKWGNRADYHAGSPQSLIGDLIRAGVTGVAGHVAEPYLDGSARPQVLFPAYVHGFNLAEAFYLSIPFISWQNVVVGDPLCAPFRTVEMAAEELAPPPDPETELPKYFSARRLDVLSFHGVRPDIARLMSKASARLLHADLPGAAHALETVTTIEPALNAAHFVLATIYDASGQYDQAIERYHMILETAQNDVRALNNIAYALAVNKKQPKDALPFALKAYSIAHDTNVELTLDLGYAVAARKGTPPNVLPFAPVGYNTAALKAQIADTVGWIYYLLGDPASAEKYLTQAALDSPNHPEVQFHVAVIKASRSEVKEARQSLHRALELDPRLAEREDVKALQLKLGPNP